MYTILLEENVEQCIELFADHKKHQILLDLLTKNAQEVSQYRTCKHGYIQYQYTFIT